MNLLDTGASNRPGARFECTIGSIAAAEIVFVDIFRSLEDLLICVESEEFYTSYANSIKAWGEYVANNYTNLLINPITRVLLSGLPPKDLLLAIAAGENYWHGFLINGIELKIFLPAHKTSYTYRENAQQTLLPSSTETSSKRVYARPTKMH